jgi:hypothetical protein
MRVIILFISIIFCSAKINAQQKSTVETGHFSGIYQTPLFSSTDASNLTTSHWDVSFQSLYGKGKTSLVNVKTLKQKNSIEKRAFLKEHASNTVSNKTAATNVTIGTNFKGNELKTWTPTDNSVAVSNNGIIVSCINYGIEYHDTAGNAIVQNQTWDAFVNNASLNQAKFDPRVIYDNLHDRFIIVLLHGFTSTTSKILVCFSKTNNPVDGWNIYQLSGNPLGDSTWTDYPTIGISDDDLFINGNRFGNSPLYKWKETYIYQIGLNEGFAGITLNYGIWNNIYTPDNKDSLATLYPASNGLGHSLKNKMYFVGLMPDSGSNVYLFQINGNLTSSNKSLTASQYSIPYYEVCANAFEKDPTTNNLDSLSSGSAWVQNAFSLNNTIHFTYCANMGSGFCGIHYGRILLDSNRVDITSYGNAGTDYTYPAVASFAYDSNDYSAVIAYLQSDTSMTPQNGVISLDHAMTWSSPHVVKTGDTVVNILFPPSYGTTPERWGDYTGIARKYNSPIPQAWMAAAYGTNTPPRLASYGTWIAQLITGENPLPVSVQNTTDKPTAKLYPNPASELFVLEFENEKAGTVTIKLYDLQGREIKTLFDDYLLVSLNRISFNKLMLPAGLYFVKATRDNTVIANEKLMIK